MARSKSYNKTYMRKYYKNTENRRIKRLRDRDRYEYESRNGKLPKGKEIDHSNGYGRGKKRVISRTANRRKGARTTNRVRRRVN